MTPAEKRQDPFDGQPPAREPMFNIPGILIVCVAVMVLIEALRAYVLTEMQDQSLVLTAAFIPARYLHPFAEQSSLAYFAGPVAYSLLHGGWAHLASNALFLVIFATPLTARIGTMRFLVLWVTSAVAAAFSLAVATGFEDTLLVGASGVVSAMAGASCRFAVPLLGSQRVTQARYAPRLGMIEAITHRSVLSFVVFWLIFNVVVAGVDSSSNIAWQAHLGGFLVGFLGVPLLEKRQK